MNVMPPTHLGKNWDKTGKAGKCPKKTPTGKLLAGDGIVIQYERGQLFTTKDWARKYKTIVHKNIVWGNDCIFYKVYTASHLYWIRDCRLTQPTSSVELRELNEAHLQLTVPPLGSNREMYLRAVFSLMPFHRSSPWWSTRGMSEWSQLLLCLFAPFIQRLESNGP